VQVDPDVLFTHGASLVVAGVNGPSVQHPGAVTGSGGPAPSWHQDAGADREPRLAELLDPDALLGRLARSLDALGAGAVDLPERQHTLRATVEWSVGLLDQAVRSLLETLAIFVDGWTIQAAAQVAGLEEDRALELSEALHAVSQLAMAGIAAVVGDLDGALRGELVSLEELRGQDEPYWTTVAVLTAGLVETAIGRHDAALGHLREARALAERFDHAGLAAWVPGAAGHPGPGAGPARGGPALLDEGLELSLATRSTRNVTLCLTAFAQLAFVEGDGERAALLAGAAEGLRQRVGLRAWPPQRQGGAQMVAQIRQALDADRFDQGFAAGTRLNRQEAVAAVRDPRGDGTAAS
jgi:hypothetical protein